MYSLRDWQQKIKNYNDIIIACSKRDGTDDWVPFPIGMPVQMNKEYKYIGPHNELVLCSVRTTTDMRRRPNPPNRKSIVETLEKNGIHNRILEFIEYRDSLSNYKFVVSPEGNGIDCHRHYEALFSGCIPIIEYNEQIQKKYDGCPILYTHDYSEITDEYLEKVYAEMIDKQYNFSRLFLSYYDKHTQRTMKTHSNFWMRVYKQKPLYEDQNAYTPSWLKIYR